MQSRSPHYCEIIAVKNGYKNKQTRVVSPIVRRDDIIAMAPAAAEMVGKCDGVRSWDGAAMMWCMLKSLDGPAKSRQD